MDFQYWIIHICNVILYACEILPKKNANCNRTLGILHEFLKYQILKVSKTIQILLSFIIVTFQAFGFFYFKYRKINE